MLVTSLEWMKSVLVLAVESALPLDWSWNLSSRFWEVDLSIVDWSSVKFCERYYNHYNYFSPSTYIFTLSGLHVKMFLGLPYSSTFKLCQIFLEGVTNPIITTHHIYQQLPIK